jgi:hypothetical protein
MPNPIRPKLITATLFASLTVAAPAGASTEKALHSFLGSPNDGATPLAGLIASGGNLYGTTDNGGGSGCGGQGSGTVSSSRPTGPPLQFCTPSRAATGLLHLPAWSPTPTAISMARQRRGGGPECLGRGCGVVFKLSSDGLPL